jgi:hypothetical protein
MFLVLVGLTQKPTTISQRPVKCRVRNETLNIEPRISDPELGWSRSKVIYFITNISHPLSVDVVLFPFIFQKKIISSNALISLFELVSIIILK